MFMAVAMSSFSIRFQVPCAHQDQVDNFFKEVNHQEPSEDKYFWDWKTRVRKSFVDNCFPPNSIHIWQHVGEAGGEDDSSTKQVRPENMFTMS